MSDTHIPEPDPALLIDYVEGRLSAEEAARVETYIEASGLWRAELELARSFAETPASADAPAEAVARARAVATGKVVALPRPVARTWTSRLLIAASVALLVIAGRELLAPGPTGGPDAQRSTKPDERKALQVEREGNGWRVRWDADPEATEARLVVTGAAGDVVLEKRAGTGDAFLEAGEIPPDRRSDALLIRVVETLRGGAERRSGLSELP